MQQDDKVRVYGEPQTDSFYQGVATCIKHISGNRWIVRFDFGRIVTRLVLDKRVELPFDENFPSQEDLC